VSRAAGCTGLIALLACLCAGVTGLGADCQGAETTRVAEVVAVGAAGARRQPLTRDCTAESRAATGSVALAVLRYRDGSRYERRWRTVRVAVPAGAHVGDRVRFDTASCSVLPAPTESRK